MGMKPRETMAWTTARRAARRWLAQQLARDVGRALAAGGVVAVGVTLGQKRWPELASVGGSWWLLPAVVVGASVAVGVVLGWRGRLGAVRAARVLDERLGLRDRLTTAVELSGHPDVFSALAVAAGDDVAARVDVRSALPWRVSRSWPVAAVVLAGVWGVERWVPAVDGERVAASVVRQDAIASLREAARVVRSVQGPETGGTESSPSPSAELDRLERELVQGTPDPVDAARRASEAIRGAAEATSHDAERSLKRSEAVKDALAKAAERAKTEAARRSDGRAEGVQELGGAVAESLARGELDAAAQRVRESAKRLDSLSPQERKSAAEEFRKIADELQQLEEQRHDAERAAPASGEPKTPSERPPDPTAERLREAANELERAPAQPAVDRPPKGTKPSEPPASGGEAKPNPKPDGKLNSGPNGKPGSGESKPADQKSPERSPSPQGSGEPSDSNSRPNPRQGGGAAPSSNPGADSSGTPKPGTTPSPSGAPERKPGPDASQRPGAEDNKGEGKPASNPAPKASPSSQPKPDSSNGEGKDGTEKPASGTLSRDEPGKTNSQGRSGEGSADPSKPGAGQRPQPARGGDKSSPGDGQGVPTSKPSEAESPAGSDAERGRRLRELAEELQRLSNEPKRAAEAQRQARRMREQAQELLRSASPEDRKRLEEIARTLGKEGQGSGGKGASNEGERSVAGAPREPWRGPTQVVDARGAGAPVEPTARERVIAEWMPQGPASRDRTGQAAATQEVRKAADAAERAVEQQAVPPAYADLVRRVFRRFAERAERPAPSTDAKESP